MSKATVYFADINDPDETGTDEPHFVEVVRADEHARIIAQQAALDAVTIARQAALIVRLEARVDGLLADVDEWQKVAEQRAQMVFPLKARIAELEQQRGGAVTKDAIFLAFERKLHKVNSPWYGERKGDWRTLTREELADTVVELLSAQRGGVVLPERKPVPDQSIFVGRPAAYAQAFDEAKAHNRCLDEVARINPPRKFRLGDPVRKTKGSQWSGRVVGFYSTELTPDGYAVESFTEKGSVQIYPGSALEPCEEPGECVAVPRELATRLCHTDYYTHLMARRELRNQLLAQQGKAVGDE